MTAYTFHLDCPECGGDVDHQASGRPAIVAARAVATCRRCAATLLVEVTVRREATATSQELRRRAMRERVPT